MAWGAGSPPIAAAEAPSGVQWKSLGPSIGTTVLAMTVVAFRFYTRIKIVRAVGRDDGVVLFSLILSIAMCAIVGAEVAIGSNLSYQSHRPTKIWVIAKLVIANNCLYAAITNLTKVSILLQYLRVFSSLVIRWICWILMFLCAGAALWAIFGGVFLCTPIGKLWEPDIPGWCMNAEHYWLSTATANVVLDFSVLILPIPKISTINLPKRQKAALVFVFLLGGFGSIVSLVRLIIVHVEALRGHYLRSGIEAITWSAVEANTGIICASVLALKPLFVHFFPHLMLSNEPARCNMRLPTIPCEGMETSHTSHRTLINTMQSGNTSQQTMVPDAAYMTPSTRSVRNKSVPSEITETDSPVTDYGEAANCAQWRVSQYGWPPGTAI